MGGCVGTHTMVCTHECIHTDGYTHEGKGSGDVHGVAPYGGDVHTHGCVHTWASGCMWVGYYIHGYIHIHTYPWWY